ncbi:hypothetical protein SUGI_0587940 [Cryptomeria japonica]|uniref:golgin candidate 5 n=1 Tax=Cryptomeria japonica TaxID=3369 RepID=UPI002414A296|nr:golgin candidate 5 [Cryptomeria japonica]XP_057854233.2 golgin candidate 5 [Cryptomeria japonica]GLJ29771.1 hypothetical protein SUGI_0587940 [Cryptomeria japonica]
MAWLNKVSFTNFPDLAGAVNKISESVKNIEKNFDSALGFEDKQDANDTNGDRRTLFDPTATLLKQRDTDDNIAVEEVSQSSKSTALQDATNISSAQSPLETVSKDVASQSEEQVQAPQSREEDQFPSTRSEEEHQHSPSALDQDEHSNPPKESENNNNLVPVENAQIEAKFQVVSEVTLPSEVLECQELQHAEVGRSEDYSDGNHLLKLSELVEEVVPAPAENKDEVKDLQENVSQEEIAFQQPDYDTNLIRKANACIPSDPEPSNLPSVTIDSKDESTVDAAESNEMLAVDKFCAEDKAMPYSNGISDKTIIASAGHTQELEKDAAMGQNQLELPLKPDSTVSLIVESDSEIEKLKREMKMMEAALQGAARQAQSKADEISRLLIENEQLKNTIEDLKKKSPEAESDALRDEYQQRLGALERKVYALTKERDTLRREQSRKSDASVLLKEKDEIIKQVMAEGEELSKKQAAQEAQMRKLRAQIRELEEEKQRLNSKLQVEEAKVESIKKDKAATEKALQEAVESSQAELAAQKEFYTNALNEAKEAEALAEARGNSEAKTELEHRLHEAGEREAALVQALEELRDTLSNTEHQAASLEDKLRNEIDHLQKRCQATEMRYEELVLRVPESTRPLLRQIEAMQESAAMRAEAWSGVERNLNSRVQEAEARAASAEERERAMNERLTQTLSRMAVLEAQVSCLRAEQAQISRSLEKERQRASENRQEYLAALETAASQEGRAKQLEEEIRELRNQHKRDMVEEMARRQLLEQELERERTTRLDLEKTARSEAWPSLEKNDTSKYTNSYLDHGASNNLRRFSSAGSASSMEESFYLQASLDSSSEQAPIDRRSTGELGPSAYFGKSFAPATIEHLEATLRQKDGELASYMTRLASLESIRDSLAEELVKMTNECEKLRIEVAALPGLRAELEALRRRHTSALELMGERDEELEELKADLADVKQMYREQIDMLVSQIEKLSSSLGSK